MDFTTRTTRIIPGCGVGNNATRKFKWQEKIEVEVTGRSKYEVAHIMAINMLTAENGGLMKAGRQAYLHAVADAIDALQGIKR